MTASLPRCAPQRRFTVDDLLSLDDFQRYHGATCALSPDGGSVCFAVIRPLADARRFDRPYLGGLDRAELYLFQFADRTLRRLAGDVRAGHAFGSPTWSPDGRWIAAIALSADDDCVHAVLIDPSTAAVTPIPAPRSVDLASPDRDGPLKWLADGRVALPLLAEGRTPIAMHLPRRLFANAHDAWEACSRGRQSTADVLDSDSFGTAPVPPAPDWWAFAPGARALDPLTHDECVRVGLSPESPVP
ncbi:TPA: PD40 domain-containing protein, partial [Burkholderia multivorans]|nr:PD40 domain-containing protein [Burkholderia multivorans]